MRQSAETSPAAPSIEQYLSGAAFSEQITLKLRQFSLPPNRADFIAEVVKGGSVIHVGCVDHLPHLEDKMAAGSWFHARLIEVSSRCLGIDINATGIALLRRRWPAMTLECGDIAKDCEIEAIHAQPWDWLVLGEVLEHTENPVQFLSAIRRNYGDTISGIVISVPNAFSAGNMRNTLTGRERINSDHRYWFTPYTLQKVGHNAGIATTAIKLCHYTRSGRAKMAAKNLICTLMPMLCENLVLVGTWRHDI